MEESAQPSGPSVTEVTPAKSGGSNPVESSHASPNGERQRPTGCDVVTGVARTPRGDAAPGLRVECQPDNTRFYKRQEHDWYTTVTGSDGAFRLDGLPAAGSYTVVVTGEGRYGQAVTLASDRNAVEVVVWGLTYERLAFFDDAGEPVDVRAKPLFLARGGLPLYYSHMAVSPEVVRRLAGAGIPDLAVESNEVLAIYREARVLKIDLRVRVVGYEPIDVPPKRRRFEDWPASDRIELRRTAASNEVSYVVDFPALEWPQAWGDRDPQIDVTLRVSKRGTSLVKILGGPVKEFSMESDAAFDLCVDGFGVLEYTVAPCDAANDARKRVTPTWPRFAFVDLRADASAHRNPNLSLLYWIDGSEPLIYGRAAEPGVVRFGPIPVGEYRFRRSWGDAAARDEPGHHFGPVQLGEGYHDLHWER
jgi:hypothetical protein